MAPTTNGNGAGKNGHTSTAVSEPVHPKDRWEMAYVWAFMQKFMPQVVSKTPGMDSVMDLEEAVLFPSATPVLETVFIALIKMCKPNTHSRLDAASITKHLLHLLENHKEWDCIWYSEKTRELRNPLAGIDDVFQASWITKLEFLRQLTDWALVADAGVREKIRAFRDATKYQTKPKDPTETQDQGDTIVIEPIGLDLERRRYWVIDNSGRMYRSGNPWKNSCPFTTITSSFQELDEEITHMEGVLETLDKDRVAKPRLHPITKWENSMRAMVKRLREDILPKVELEENRQTKKRKAQEIRQNYIHLHELRETRTRRQTNKPRYVYEQMSGEEDNGDDFIDDGGDNYFSDEEPDRKRLRATRAQPTRHSGRISAAQAAKEDADHEMNGREWRGERRSGRFGGPSLDDPSSVAGPSSPAVNSDKLKSVTPLTPAFDDDEIGAQQIFESVRQDKKRKEDQLRNTGGVSRPKDSEVIVEAPKGKKSGKFWFYAVEPVNQPGTLEIPDPPDIRRRPRKSRASTSTVKVQSEEPSRDESKEPSERAAVSKDEDADMELASRDESTADSKTLTNGSGSRHDAVGKDEVTSPGAMEVDD